MKTKDITAWEVTSKVCGPRMFCAYATESGIDAEYAVIRAVMKMAKARGVAVVAITLSIDKNALPGATLVGTHDYKPKAER